eukprot:CAMPEP_0197185436 /NCGR_PEP_ID=MMETSP1423-20130617/11905_1 /TAXON_ID=476441 /ORGANISM="Pseudo-nitzschia heimii, Strain UNC1101" /LENGTH=527 /DNA_ID=CAMNT_0042636491 /DNA_START=188 /DNA_END=1771 /DNA_ORIENTATION=+
MVSYYLKEGKAHTRRKRARLPSTATMGLFLVGALFVGVILFPSVAMATVFLPEYNRSFASLPGLFGAQLSSDKNDLPTSAFLTIVKDQPLMCPDELKRIQPMPPSSSTNNNSDGNGHNLDSSPTALDSSMMIKKNSTIDWFKDIEPLPPPRDGLPIALLVERGMCTFYEKAVMASKYGPSVKYVIIYDDEITDDLVPMSSEYETDMTLLFVSAKTGRFLEDKIYAGQRYADFGADDNSTYLGFNLIIQMDGVSPVLASPYPGLNMAAYFLAAMSGFLAFLIFFGCLLVCAQCGCITAAPDEHGRIVLFAGGPGIRHTEGLARMIRVDKLTVDQVMLLDEEEYEAPSSEGGDDGDSSGCCAICLDEFEDKEKVRVLPCGHKFREDCLIPWLTQRHASCPLCKMNVLKYVQEIEKKNKVDSVDSVEKKFESIEAPDGSPDDTASSSTTQNSSRARSFLYRLRGWSLVANSAPPEAHVPGAGGDGNTVGATNTTGSFSGSEIEMGSRIPRSENSNAAAVTGHETEMGIDP